MNERSYAIREGDDWVPVDGAYTIKGGSKQLVDDPQNPGAMVMVTSDLQLPMNWRDVYSDEEIHAFGFREIASPDPVPAGRHLGALTVKGPPGKPKWVYESTPMDLEVARRIAFDQLAAGRWEASQMMTFGDDEGQALVQAHASIPTITAILEDRQRREVDPDETQNFKLANGVFRVWGEPHLRMFLGLALHRVQACFDIEAEATKHILAAESPTAVFEILGGVGWP